MPIQPSYQPGQRIGGQYLVFKALAGGMGEVFLCFDEESKNPYALKTFQRRFNAPGLKDSFFEEVGHWVALEKHANIVRCHFMDTVDNRPFMFLEWVANDEARGTSLRDWLRRGPLDVKTALGFTIDILRGLQHAGEKSPGIVHRDLKPENVLIGQNRLAKITDFGLATIGAHSHLISDGDGSDLRRSVSMAGGIAGTPYYMPPEQWRGEKPDVRADLYAVGCILYEMLTGNFLYTATTFGGLRTAHLELPLPNLSQLVWAADFLQRCLAKRREDRFSGVMPALQALTALYVQQVGEDPPAAPTADALNAAELSNRGATLAALGRREEALADFTQAIQIDPTLASVYYNRGLTFDALGRREEALADYTQAIQIDPVDAQAYSNRGATLAALGRLEEALADYTQAIHLDPAFAQAYSNRGTMLATLGRLDEALADHTQAIHLDPAFAQAYSNRGLTFDALRRLEEALADFTQAIHLDPADAQVYYSRGNTLYALGYPTEALSDFTQAIHLDPVFSQAHYNRATILIVLGRQEEALAGFTQAIQIDQNFAQAYFNRGVTFADLGRRAEALADFTQAIHLDPALATAYYNLGALLAKSGQLQESLSYFERAAELGDSDAPNAIAQVRRALGLAPATAADPAQAAFDAFASATSPDQMRQAVRQHPILIQPNFIQLIEQVIQQKVPPAQRPAFQQRLAWLRQIAGN